MVLVKFARDAGMIVMAGKYAGMCRLVSRFSRSDQGNTCPRIGQIPRGGTAHQTRTNNDGIVSEMWIWHINSRIGHLNGFEQHMICFGNCQICSRNNSTKSRQG